MTRTLVMLRNATFALACAAVFAMPAAAQGPGASGFDPLGRLKRSLSQAGANALTTAQQDRLKALIDDYRASRTTPAPSTALETARREYDNAILNADSAGAAAQADIIATEQTANAKARLKAEANFGISVVKELRTNGDQIGALLKTFGTNGVIRLVLSLAGGGPGPGRGPGGMDPGMGGMDAGFAPRSGR